jgi:hypothetical protein
MKRRKRHPWYDILNEFNAFPMCGCSGEKLKKANSKIKNGTKGEHYHVLDAKIVIVAGG